MTKTKTADGMPIGFGPHEVEAAHTVLKEFGFDEAGRDCAMWRPVETAPKDGSRFIALDYDGDVAICRWSSGEKRDETAWMFDLLEQKLIPAWHERDEFERLRIAALAEHPIPEPSGYWDFDLEYTEPVAWMPFPENTDVFRTGPNV